MFYLYFYTLGKSLGQNDVTVYLVPHIGLEFPMSFFADKNSLPPYVFGTFTNSSLRYGLTGFVDINSNLGLEVGYFEGAIGFGVKARSQTDSAINHV